MPASCATAPRSKARCCSAQAWLEIMEKGPGFSALLWDFLDGKPKVNRLQARSNRCRRRRRCRARCRRSSASRGFKFVGPTIVYAFMQAVGMVNDHLVTCHRHDACAKLGETAAVPSPKNMRAGAAQAQQQRPQTPRALAAHAVGPPARPARPLPARCRDRGHRAWPRARGALERADQRRAYLLGGAAHAAGRGDRARADAAARPHGCGLRSCCTTRRNM